MLRRWLIGSFDRDLRAFQGHLVRIGKAVAELSTKVSTAERRIDESSQAELHARVMDLERAFEKMTNTQRRELGAIHRKVAVLAGREAEAAPEAETPDQVRARLRLANGLPTVGPRRNGAEE